MYYIVVSTPIFPPTFKHIFLTEFPVQPITNPYSSPYVGPIVAAYTDSDPNSLVHTDPYNSENIIPVTGGTAIQNQSPNLAAPLLLDSPIGDDTTRVGDLRRDRERERERERERDREDRARNARHRRRR